MIAVVVLKKWAKLRRQPPATRRDVMDTNLGRLVVMTGVSDHQQTVRRSEICPRRQQCSSTKFIKRLKDSSQPRGDNEEEKFEGLVGA